MNKYLVSLAEQVVFAYLASFVGLLLTEWSGEINMSVLTAAAVAAVPAALAVVKSGIARYFGDPESANFTR